MFLCLLILLASISAALPLSQPPIPRRALLPSLPLLPFLLPPPTLASPSSPSFIELDLEYYVRNALSPSSASEKRRLGPTPNAPDTAGSCRPASAFALSTSLPSLLISSFSEAAASFLPPSSPPFPSQISSLQASPLLSKSFSLCSSLPPTLSDQRYFDFTCYCCWKAFGNAVPSSAARSSFLSQLGRDVAASLLPSPPPANLPGLTPRLASILSSFLSANLVLSYSGSLNPGENLLCVSTP